MSNSNNNLKFFKNGFNGAKKKIGISFVRYFFCGVEASTGSEQQFFVEYEMLNPWLSPNEVQLGFKPRIKINEEDLQYALAGTQSAQNLDTETLVLPSYCAIRVGMLGKRAKQLCSYVPVKDVIYNTKPFEISIGNKTFTDTSAKGFLSISQEEKSAHPELLCDSGYATWDISYEVSSDNSIGYSGKDITWFPYGVHASYTGKINFDGIDYIVDPRKCCGYLECYWGNSIPEPWFHISTSNLTSVITGKTLFNSAFAVHGIFDDRISFTGSFEGLDFNFCADSSKRKYNSIWDCNQMTEADNPDENLIHWSVSINNKNWIIDLDIYCKVKELYNRLIELPCGERTVLNLLEGATGTGEIKLYKVNGTTLEQIEHANFNKVICEIGHKEVGEI